MASLGSSLKRDCQQAARTVNGRWRSARTDEMSWDQTVAGSLSDGIQFD